MQVIARDLAGNATSSLTQIEILPIESPEILSLTANPYVGEGGLSASGAALPEVLILAFVKKESGEKVFESQTKSSAAGTWSLTFDAPLKKGNYYVEIIAEDNRGASSLPVKSDLIALRDRPVLVLGKVALTYQTFVVGLIAAMVITFALGFWTRQLAKEGRRRRILIAQRDFNSQLANIRQDVEKIMSNHKTKEDCVPESIEASVNFLLKKIDDNIKKNTDYIVENIEEIG